jgi:hypothetical protein
MGNFIVEIPPGSGNHYRYVYNSDTKRTDYVGPVGETPTLNEEEFNRWLIFRDSQHNMDLRYREPMFIKKWLEEDNDSDPEWASYIVVPGRDTVLVDEKKEWFYEEKIQPEIDDVSGDEMLDEDLIGEFDTWKEAVEAMSKDQKQRAIRLAEARKRFGIK